MTRTERLEKVEHILASSTGVLDFAAEGENEYHTWSGSEEADWEVEDVVRVENADEDRFIIYPEAEYFVCEIEADEEDTGAVRCYCE